MHSILLYVFKENRSYLKSLQIGFEGLVQGRSFLLQLFRMGLQVVKQLPEAQHRVAKVAAQSVHYRADGRAALSPGCI